MPDTATARNAEVPPFEVAPSGGAPPHPRMLLDLDVLVIAGGRECTVTEHSDLLSGKGFQVGRVIPTADPMSIVDSVAALP